MSDLARLLQQYGYGEQPNALAQDGVAYDTSNVLAGMPKKNALADALRVAGAPPRDEHGFLFSNVDGELKFNPYEAIKGFMGYRAPPGALSTSGDDTPVRNSAEAAGWLGMSGLGLNFAGAIPKGAVGSGSARLAANSLAMDEASRMARAAEMGFDTPAYHATGAVFDEFKPHPYRGASFFARTEADAQRGATAGANDMTGSGGSRMMNVMLPSNEIQGLALTKPEREWWSALPERLVDDGYGSAISSALDNRPDNISSSAKRMPWYYIYDEKQLPDGRFEYTRLPMPKLDWETAAKTDRDVYGSKWSHYGKGSEAYSSNNAKANGMAGFAHQDEAGLAIGIVNPRRIRSVDAAFDPRMRNSANIFAASGSPIGVMLPNTKNQE